MELSDGDGDGATPPTAGGAPACADVEEGTAPEAAPPGDDDAGDALPAGAGAADALAGGTALGAAEAEELGAGAALADGTVQGAVGGAVKLPALDARLGSGSALFE
jgi:hypothetical protein